MAAIDETALEALFERADRTAARSACAVQVAVGWRGALAGFRTFGHAPHGGSAPRAADDGTLFATFSVTKALTSAAAWLLLYEGRLALGDRVVEHIPEFGAHGKDSVTVEHLLTHTAGLPSAEFPIEAWPDPERRVRLLADWHLEWEPGSRFVYHGGSSMWVLAELITRIAGVDYRDFVRERIFDPLGLHDFFLGLPADQNARVADVVAVGEAPTREQRAASPVDAPSIDPAHLPRVNSARGRAIASPGGGAIATAADVARFYQALLGDAAGLGPGIWQPEILRDAWTIRRPELVDPMTGQPALRGLGVVIAGHEGKIWRGFADACSPRAFGHMGAGGQISWADPETGLSFCLLTNGAEIDPVRQGANGLRLSALAAACAPRDAPARPG